MKSFLCFMSYIVLYHGFMKAVDSQYLTSVPVNTATVSGGVVTLDCSTNSTSQLTWSFIPYGTSRTVPLVVNCAVNPIYSAVYSVQSTNTGQCNLIIQTNTSVAGVYTCSSQFLTANADLIILDSDPVVVTNASETGMIAYANQYVIIFCEVNYTGSITPSMSWTSAGGITLTNSTTFNNSRSVLSFVEIPAYPNTAWNTYNCETYFDASYPAFSYNVSAPDLVVYYCPTAIAIYPNGGQIGQGQILTCSVSGGNPAPSYQWINLETGVITYGPTLALWVTGNYWYECIATSPVCNVTATANGTVFGSSTSSPGTTSTTAIIVGAVCGGVVVIALVILFVFIYIKCRRDKKDTKPSEGNPDDCSRNDYASDEQLERHASGIHSRSVRNGPPTDYIRDFNAPAPPPVYRYPTPRQTPETSISIADSSVYSGHRSHYGEIEI